MNAYTGAKGCHYNDDHPEEDWNMDFYWLRRAPGAQGLFKPPKGEVKKD